MLTDRLCKPGRRDAPSPSGGDKRCEGSDPRKEPQRAAIKRGTESPARSTFVRQLPNGSTNFVATSFECPLKTLGKLRQMLRFLVPKRWEDPSG